MKIYTGNQATGYTTAATAYHRPPTTSRPHVLTARSRTMFPLGLSAVVGQRQDKRKGEEIFPTREELRNI